MITGELLMGGAMGTTPNTLGPEGRPVSFADALDAIARWMDRTDKIMVRRGEKKALSDGKVQADLRRAARALREDPTLDALMVDAMLHGPEYGPEAGDVF